MTKFLYWISVIPPVFDTITKAIVSIYNTLHNNKYKKD